MSRRRYLLAPVAPPGATAAMNSMSRRHSYPFPKPRAYEVHSQNRALLVYAAAVDVDGATCHTALRAVLSFSATFPSIGSGSLATVSSGSVITPPGKGVEPHAPRKRLYMHSKFGARQLEYSWVPFVAGSMLRGRFFRAAPSARGAAISDFTSDDRARALRWRAGEVRRSTEQNNGYRER